MSGQIPAKYVRTSDGGFSHPTRVVRATEWLREVEEKMAKEEEIEPCKIPFMAANRRIRQSSKPLLNDLESEFMTRIQDEYPDYIFHAQAIRFKLGNGIWYKPDFVGFFDRFPAIRSWEVKGPFAHRGGFENLKVAAHQYPEIKWTLVWKQDGTWKEQTVLP